LSVVNHDEPLVIQVAILAKPFQVEFPVAVVAGLALAALALARLQATKGGSDHVVSEGKLRELSFQLVHPTFEDVGSGGGLSSGADEAASKIGEHDGE